MPAISHLEIGDACGHPLLILHGLFGSGRNWRTIARALASHGWRVFALDAPNHGRSAWTDHAVTYPLMAAECIKWMDENGIDSAHVIGHSMGGKTAMRLALDHSERVNALVVVDIAPTAYGPDHEHLSYIAAMRGVDLTLCSRRRQVADSLSTSVPSQSMRLFLSQNIDADDATGALCWRLNLETLARSVDNLRAFPIAPNTSSYDKPTLFIAGGASDYIVANSQQVRDHLFPKNKLVVLEKLGHWPHAENPTLFFEKTCDFLQNTL